MKKSTNKQTISQASDFFTIIPLLISLGYLEYSCDLSVTGNLTYNTGVLMPEAINYKIVSVKLRNKEIHCPPILKQHIDEYWKNNPKLINSLVFQSLAQFIVTCSPAPQSSKNEGLTMVG